MQWFSSQAARARQRRTLTGKALSAALLSALILPAGHADTLLVAITVDVLVAGGAPVITAATTADQDGDGQVDHLVLSFSQPVTISDPNGAADGLPCLTLGGGYQIAAGTYTGVAVNTLTLALVPSGTPDTGALISATYLAAGTGDISSSGNTTEVADASVTAGSDGAAPVLISAITRDGNADGRAEAVLLRWSEAYVPASLAAADLTVAGQVVAGTSSTLGGAAAGADGAFALLASPLAGDATPTVATLSGRLRDAAGNLARAGNRSALDRVAPAALNVQPVSGDFVSDTLVAYTLTEACAAGAITWTRIGGAADPRGHTSVLTAAELITGSHGPGLLSRPPTLVAGAVYDLAFTLTDPAGNGTTRLISNGVTYFNRANWPRIVSESELAVAAGGAWTYDVVADVRGQREGPPSHRPVSETIDLVFALGSGAPAGMTLARTGATSARVSWPDAAGAEHVRVRVVVTDRVSGNGDLQEVLIYVVPSPGGGG